MRIAVIAAICAGCSAPGDFGVDSANGLGDVHSVAAGSRVAIHADVSLGELELEVDRACAVVGIDGADHTRGTVWFETEVPGTESWQTWPCVVSTRDERLDGEGTTFEVAMLRHLAIRDLRDPARVYPRPAAGEATSWSPSLLARRAAVYRGAHLHVAADYWNDDLGAGLLNGYGLETWWFDGVTSVGSDPQRRQHELVVTSEQTVSISAYASGSTPALLELAVVPVSATARVSIGGNTHVLVWPNIQVFEITTWTAEGTQILGAVDYAVEDVATGDVLVAGTGWAIDAAPIRDHLERGGGSQLRTTAAGIVQVQTFELRMP